MRSQVPDVVCDCGYRPKSRDRARALAAMLKHRGPIGSCPHFRAAPILYPLHGRFDSHRVLEMLAEALNPR